MSAPIPTVFVVDDDTSFRTAISRLLRAAGYTVEDYPSSGAFLARIRSGPEPAGCALLDLSMPGQNGLELQAALAASSDPLPVVFLTGRGDIASSVHAMRKGAEDFLTKLAPKETVLGAVDRALARDASERLRRRETRALRERFSRLTSREHEVLSHVLQGALNKQIAGALGIDERSVKRHRTSFMGKLGVESVAQLVKLAHVAAYTSPKGP